MRLLLGLLLRGVLDRLGLLVGSTDVFEELADFLDGLLARLDRLAGDLDRLVKSRMGRPPAWRNPLK